MSQESWAVLTPEDGRASMGIGRGGAALRSWVHLRNGKERNGFRNTAPEEYRGSWKPNCIDLIPTRLHCELYPASQPPVPMYNLSGNRKASCLQHRRGPLTPISSSQGSGIMELLLKRKTPLQGLWGPEQAAVAVGLCFFGVLSLSEKTKSPASMQYYCDPPGCVCLNLRLS